MATNNYPTPNVNAEGACPPVNTGGDKAFAPVRDLVTQNNLHHMIAYSTNKSSLNSIPL